MKKQRESLNQFFYDEQGESLVSQQIMNAYNGGVIDSIDGQYDMSYYDTDERL